MCKHLDDARIDLTELFNIQRELSEIPHSSNPAVHRLTATVNRATSSLCGLDHVACHPVVDIKQFACRIADKNIKVASLKNLPDVVTKLIMSCLLEGLQLGVPKIIGNPNTLAPRSTKYWMELFANNEARKEELLKRKLTCAAWAFKLRQTLGSALNDMKKDLLIYYRKG
ncbi:hypothetical protein ANCCAN_09036 [Ancylostoma caninum]|uniref:Uncharacterized protein n=1 Tax=Ancylostoma caninum TaxID=29170 RepID=A0A368GKM7_ANCCA|nr:hypothetical protein ANCCAN_09036 [Ancylostoma caninum]